MCPLPPRGDQLHADQRPELWIDLFWFFNFLFEKGWIYIYIVHPQFESV